MGNRSVVPSLPTKLILPDIGTRGGGLLFGACLQHLPIYQGEAVREQQGYPICHELNTVPAHSLCRKAGFGVCSSVLNAQIALGEGEFGK